MLESSFPDAAATLRPMPKAHQQGQGVVDTPMYTATLLTADIGRWAGLQRDIRQPRREAIDTYLGPQPFLQPGLVGAAGRGTGSTAPCGQADVAPAGLVHPCAGCSHTV